MSSPSLPSAPTRPQVATLLACASLTVMAGATIAPALPKMAEHFRALAGGAEVSKDVAAQTEFLVRLSLTGPGLLTAIVSLLAGPLVDRLGRRGPLIAGLLLYIVAGTSGLYLDDLYAILVGRALLGAAVALVMVATTALVADLFAGPQRARINGLQGAAMSFGGVLFLVVAGSLAKIGWRTPFLIYFLALLPLVGVILLIADARKRDAAGAGVGSEAVPGSVAGSVSASGSGSNLGSASSSGGSPGSATASPGPGGGQAADANYDRLGFAGILVLAFLGMVAFYMTPTQIPFLLRSIGEDNPLWAGIGIALGGAIGGAVAMNYGRIKAKLPFLAITGAQFVLMGLGYGGHALATSLWHILLAAAVAGLGQGVMLANGAAWVAAIAPAALRGRLSGLLISAIFLGQFLSPIIVKPIGDRVGLSGEFGVAAGILLAGGLALLLASWLRRQSLRGSTQRA